MMQNQKMFENWNLFYAKNHSRAAKISEDKNKNIEIS